MNFIRPEVAQQLSRWRESLAGGAVAAFGFYWLLTETGARLMLGVVLAAAGALLIFAGIQRARFRQSGMGPGMVQIDEGQLTYFGPYDGGTLSVEDLLRLELDPAGVSGPTWILSHGAGGPLQVPVDAAGADELFDVFATLPGLETETMLMRLQKQPHERVVIWERAKVALH
jgi:hypothetical protein